MECNASTASSAKFSRFVKKVTSEVHCLQLAKLYTKKCVSISCFAAFGNKSWVQVVSLASSFGGSYFSSGSGSGFFSLGVVYDEKNTVADYDSSSIVNCLASLKCFLELLADQVSSVLCRLNGVKLVSLVLVSKVGPSVVPVFVSSMSDANMVLNILQPSILSLSSKMKEKSVDLGLSSSKVLTSKVEVKSVMREFRLLGTSFASMNELNLGNMISIVTKTKLRSNIKLWIINKFNGVQVFITDAGVAIIMDTFLAQHVSKIDKIPVNTFDEYLLTKATTWSNSKSVERVIDFILVWLAIDGAEASKIDSIILTGVSSMELIKHLSIIRKKYQRSKYCESKIAKDTVIRKTINRYMENFCSDKEGMIKNILECLFCKVVLDYLVVDDELVVEPKKVMLKVDKIMEG
ncbi:hypothetical protein G9A89_000775 [Geosiphon pyriformis]|nr:hypothetical protein G9A89_000775 [Geosiphon pyriformis]